MEFLYLYQIITATASRTKTVWVGFYILTFSTRNRQQCVYGSRDDYRFCSNFKWSSMIIMFLCASGSYQSVIGLVWWHTEWDSCSEDWWVRHSAAWGGAADQRNSVFVISAVKVAPVVPIYCSCLRYIVHTTTTIRHLLGPWTLLPTRKHDRKSENWKIELDIYSPTKYLFLVQ